MNIWTLERWDENTINEFVRRLEEHYPHSPTICKTIHRVANEMLKKEKNND